MKKLFILIVCITYSCTIKPKVDKMETLTLKETTVTTINNTQIGCSNIFIDEYKEKSDSVKSLKSKMKTQFGNLKDFVSKMASNPKVANIDFNALSSKLAILQNTFNTGLNA